MPLAKSVLESKLRDAFPDAEIAVVDTAGDQDHYAVTIVSKKFEGLTRVQQHKLVQAAIPELQNGTLHAMSLTTKLP